MFDHYAEQGLAPDRTVAYEVTELTSADGSHPLLHVEHLGVANVSFVEEQIARAGGKEDDADARGRLARSRDLVARHSVRRMERVFRGDGSQATDTDIAGFVNAMPLGAFTRLLAFAMSESGFVKIATPPGELAEKS